MNTSSNAELLHAKEPLHDHLYEAMPLWEAHWRETEGYRAEQGYNPDLHQYARGSLEGWFNYYTARNERGQLVGHLGYIVHTSRHTKKINAVEDFFYLKPEYRSGGKWHALKLLRFVVAQLKLVPGISQIGMSSKLTNDIEPLLRRVGFKFVAKFFVLNVEGE